MRTLAIESNGRIEKTAVYINGEQIAGIRELFLQIDEEGSFNTVIEYTGTDGQAYTKNIFADHLHNIKTVPPTFTEEEAQELQLLVIESDGDVEDTLLTFNDEPLEGVVELLIHIQREELQQKRSITSLFSKKQETGMVSFKAEITFRDEDDSLVTEDIF